MGKTDEQRGFIGIIEIHTNHSMLNSFATHFLPMFLTVLMCSCSMPHLNERTTKAHAYYRKHVEHCKSSGKEAAMIP